MSSWKPGRLFVLVFISLVFVKAQGQQHNVIRFGSNFYYAPEGKSAKVCLVIANFVKRITGTITSKDHDAKGGVDYDNTDIPVDITTKPSAPVCYSINLPDDSSSEGIESFAVIFTSNNSSDIITRNKATVTITDDDDVNECALGTHNCRGFDACVNTDGSFRCIDDDDAGFFDNGLTCEDFDECAEGTHNCPDNATCNNTVGSFKCDCNPGFNYSDSTNMCEDFDECAEGTHNCPGNSTCNNTVGSFKCDCNPGFNYSDTTNMCQDIDECGFPVSPCHANATCTDTEGSYTCTCITGYTGNATFCEDIDECKTGKHDCMGMMPSCFNTPGSYICGTATTGR